MIRLIIAMLLLAIPAVGFAQQPNTGPFAPITIDAQKYQEIDTMMAKQSMPREAHVGWMQLWQQLERQAQQDAATAKAKDQPNKGN